MVVDTSKNFWGTRVEPVFTHTVREFDIGEYVDNTQQFPEMNFSISNVTPKSIPADYGINEHYAQFPAIPPIPEPKLPNYRYSEGKNMKEFVDYVNSTYSAHYTSKNEIQALDVFEALGSLFTTSRDLAIKYLWRAGKKGTKEDTKKDLLKVMHYCIFMLHAMDKEKE